MNDQSILQNLIGYLDRKYVKSKNWCERNQQVGVANTHEWWIQNFQTGMISWMVFRNVFDTRMILLLNFGNLNLDDTAKCQYQQLQFLDTNEFQNQQNSDKLNSVRLVQNLISGLDLTQKTFTADLKCTIRFPNTSCQLLDYTILMYTNSYLTFWWCSLSTALYKCEKRNR